ncbi:MAG TPA: UbiD family decarboxylase [Burkholderiales bacterium]|nr:UbiD family decarboxylase [Burkholderiales bacterium]
MLNIRQFLAALEAEGDLVRIRDRISARYDIVALTRQASDQGGPALLFENVEGSRFPVLSGLFGTQRRVAKALGVAEDELFERYREREGRVIEPQLLAGAPFQEVVWKGADIDLSRLPILHHYEKDGGAYITAGLQVAKDPQTGVRNVSIHRLLPLGRDRLTVFAPPGRHLRTIIERNEERGRGTPIATAIACSPAAQIGSQARAPYGTDEFAVAGGLAGEAVQLARCASIDVEVPADSEMVIEGVTIPGERADDGPFGEYPGTYSDVKPVPVMQVTAIAFRNGALYQNTLTGMPMTENHFMMQPAATALAWREAARITPEVKAVNVTAGGTCRHHVVVSIKKRHASEARNVGLALLASPLGAKYVVIVDHDIDVFDPLQVEWAMNIRMQADRDVVIIPDLYSPTLDPSAPASRTSAKMLVDATAPLGRLEEFQPPRIPGIEKLPLSRYWKR